ncbi:phage tail protein [Gluconacetobacter azotocaptans]|uniref:Phage tail protein n=1 Tax=Gluconacetobacter azotocaptans TaxID=142834 RepID=A0A7W4JQS7_9PROT|nr:phage tail protein [Gluconacetobacter azotocaptans]MBB2189218.1 phage tail protein [Gluconacetobacter azotocaptans]GBQ32300.1 bacteriophage tail protein [Gluconacetobacter azotocaptans DSM 13594]
MSGLLSSIGDVLGYGNQPSDAVSIVVGGVKITGWTEVQIRCGVEIMPWSADLIATEWQPDSQTAVTINEGDVCQILIGNDPVITGYVITVDREITPDSHTVHVAVASKSIDLVESAAEIATYQLNSMNALAIIQKLAATAGISVYPVNGAGNVDIQIFSIILSETAYEAIERVCRLANCLFYDRPDGNITLAPVGTTIVPSAFAQGRNVEAARVRASQAGRFASIQAIIQTPLVLTQSPTSSDYVSEFTAKTKPVNAIAYDQGVTNTRPWRKMLLPIEAGDDANYDYAKRRVQWESNRRYGRSQVIELTCDSWRDGQGNLWAPNTVAQVSLKALKRDGIERLIVELVFRRDEGGTHCDVTLMPPEAMTPEPILLPVQQNEGMRAITSTDTAPLPGGM